MFGSGINFEKKLLPFLRGRQAWLAHRDIREHGRYGSPATINQTPNGFPDTTTTHFPVCLMWPLPWKRQREKMVRSTSAFWRKGQGRLAKVGQVHISGERVLLSILYVWNFWHTLSPHLTSPTFMPSSLFTLPSISLPVSPFYPLHPSLFFRVLRPESNLQQLSKSGMTDKLIFSSWVYIPGIWAADLAPNKRGVSASCLLKLMFSWPEMNYPVTRIYLYSS